jgi:hypothetical protein
MPILYRRGTLEDSHSVFQVFVKTIMDYSERRNVMTICVLALSFLCSVSEQEML